ncbi:MAG: autotransporter-associated beta strand repeat-containing protein, partial [bacterium]|nr:autotransporter-associated beta strand repeat-containing protein [bacterium]
MKKSLKKIAFTLMATLLPCLGWSEVTSFGVNFMTAADQEINSAAGYTVDGYEAPSTWGNFTGSADGSGDVSPYKVYWTSRGTHNSACSTDTDNKKLLYGYLDDVANSGRTKATVTITGLPDDKQYAVALILSGDGNGNADFNNRYSPVLINGETYAYDGDGTTLLVGDDAAEVTYWGSRAKTVSANGELVEGTNVMFVEGLSGSILSITSAMDQWNVSRLTIAGVQVWITDEEAVVPAAPEDKETISLNFGSEKGSVGDALAGLRNVGAWNDLTTDSDSGVSLRAWNGNATIEVPINYSFGSSTIYQWTDATDAFLKGYLDDGSHDSVNGATITMSEIPFETYSVIVYCATDTENAFFRPVQINGTWYAGSASARGVGYALPVLDVEKDAITWGASQNTTAAYGTNAIRVDGLSGELSIQGLGKAGTNNKHRGGIAAIQIVNIGEILIPKATITGNVEASDIVWESFTPIAETDAIIDVNAEATITMNKAITAKALEIKGDHKLTFVSSTALEATTTALNATTTTINTDTDVSDVTANLGAVTIAAGKKLTVKTPSVFSSLSATATSVVETTEDYTLASSLSPEDMLIRVKSGKLTLGNGDWSNKFTVGNGATLDLNGKGNYRGTNGSKTAPLITLEDGAKFKSSVSMSHGTAVLNEIALAQGATATLTGQDFRTVAPGHGKTALALNGGTLNINMDGSGNDTRSCYFYNMFVVKAPTDLSAARSDNLPTVTDVAGTINLQSGKLYFTNNGRARFDCAKLALNPLENKIANAIFDYRGQGAGGTLTINYPLTIGALGQNTEFAGAISGTGAFTKVGTGTLTLSGANTHTGSVTVSEGTIAYASDASLVNAFTGEG